MCDLTQSYLVGPYILLLLILIAINTVHSDVSGPSLQYQLPKLVQVLVLSIFLQLPSCPVSRPLYQLLLYTMYSPVLGKCAQHYVVHSSDAFLTTMQHPCSIIHGHLHISSANFGHDLLLSVSLCDVPLVFFSCLLPLSSSIHILWFLLQLVLVVEL